jgi:gas vesicle protein
MQIYDFLSRKSDGTRTKSALNIIIGAGIGSLIGLVAGVLLAPKSGKETRKYIRKGAKAAVNTVKSTVNDAKGKLSETAKPNSYEFRFRYRDSKVDQGSDGTNEFTDAADNDNIDNTDTIEDESGLENTFEDKDKCCDD